MTKKKILFLLKRNNNYGSESTSKAGLFNSASILAKQLESHFNVEAKVVTVIDGNSVDKEVHEFKPDVCIIEALWVTPGKLSEVQRLHPSVRFIVRIHSNVPFLANEGIAIEWIKKYRQILGVRVAFNNGNTVDNFNQLFSWNGAVDYLPNVYDSICNKFDADKYINQIIWHSKKNKIQYKKDYVNIGLFGAIRPLKNGLIQAMAAIAFGDRTNTVVHFHINGTRIENKGESVLKNIRALFEGSKHKLIEHPWLSHDDFLKLVKIMDVGMQVSLSESFNIVTADFVSQRVPIIVSPQIEWMDLIAKVDPYSVEKMVWKLNRALRYKHLFTELAIVSLNHYNFDSLKVWQHQLHLS